MGQCFVADGGGEKQLVGLVDGESSGVSGDGANGDTGSVGLESSLVEDLPQGDARPVLGRMPAASAVEGGGQLRLVGGDFRVVEGEFSFDAARYLEGPKLAGSMGCGSSFIQDVEGKLLPEKLAAA